MILEIVVRLVIGPASHLRFTKNPTFLKSAQNRIPYTFEKIGFFDISDFPDFGAAPDRRLKFLPPFEVEPLARILGALHT